MRSYALTAAVRQQAQRVFAPTELAEALALLAKTPLPLLPTMSAETERVHLAVLHLSGGTLPRLRDMLQEAQSDWRDVLLGAGLGHGNWREVLEGRSVAPSLTPDHGIVTNVGWLGRLFRWRRPARAGRR